MAVTIGALLVFVPSSSDVLGRNAEPEAVGRPGGVRSEEWERTRAEILSRAEKVMGPFPGGERRVALEMEVLEEVDCGAYVRQKIRFRTEPGSRVPAYLLIPADVRRGKTRAPAVLCLHPTDRSRGPDVAVGLTDKVNRSYAEELAIRGYVTLAPAYPFMGGYEPELEVLGYASGTMKAIWDNVRALDLLDSLPFVDSGRGYGAIGHSLGGHNAIFTAAFDTRIRVTVSSCGFDSFRDYKDGNIQGWTSRHYMPRLLDYPLEEIPFDFVDLLSALAPRTVFVSAPLHDGNFKWESVARIVEAVGPVFERHGAKEKLTVVYPDAGHDFPPEIRERAYEMIREVLKP